MALWKARTVAIKIGKAITDPGSSSSDFWTLIDAQTGPVENDLEKVAKNATFKEPERDSDTVLLLGATSGAQNSELDEKGSDSAELTCTLVLNPETDNKFDLWKRKLTVHGTIATSWDTRYNFNSASPSAGVAIVVQFSDGTNKTNFLLNNCSITTTGGFSVEADSHAEQELKITCAPDDCWAEDNFSSP